MLQSMPKARMENIVIHELHDEVLVYDLLKNKAHCLNISAAFVWKQRDGLRSQDEIASEFARKRPCETPAEIVSLAIDQLSSSDLLQTSETITQPPSRRQLIKKFGFAASVALPLVQSLVAPTTLYASVNCSCTNDAQCITQTGCPTMTCGANGQCIA